MDPEEENNYIKQALATMAQQGYITDAQAFYDALDKFNLELSVKMVTAFAYKGQYINVRYDDPELFDCSCCGEFSVMKFENNGHCINNPAYVCCNCASCENECTCSYD